MNATRIIADVAAFVVSATAESLIAATLAVVKVSHQSTPTLCWNSLQP